MRQMWDGVTPGNIPADAQMVAGYVDGKFAWSPADWDRFPHAVKVRIAVWPHTDDGHVLDIESGDARPEQAPHWCEMRRAAGVHPSVYCSDAIWPQVKGQFHQQGVAEPEYWIASYPGIGPELYPGAVAHQYADPGPFDLSVVADHWPGVDPAIQEGDVDMAWDMNIKRAVIFGFRTGTLGQWPESVGAVDAYAAQIANDGSNVEAVIDGIRQDFQKNGGTLLMDRVNALEAKLAKK